MGREIKKKILNRLYIFYKNPLINKLYVRYNKSYLKHLIMYLKYGDVDIVTYLESSKHNVIFVPVPKVATTSIIYTIHEKGKFDSFFTKTIKKKDKYVFSFVRNPFSRTVSCYKCCVLHPTNTFSFKYYEKKYKKPQISFSNYVKAISKIEDRYSDSHFKSQHSVLYKKYNLIKPNYIGKIENINKDFEVIRKKFKLKKLQHTNITKKKGEDWRDYYTLELARLVYKRYKKDFDLWYPNAYEELKEYLKNK